jgi:hypothetical protein
LGNGVGIERGDSHGALRGAFQSVRRQITAFGARYQSCRFATAQPRHQVDGSTARRGLQSSGAEARLGWPSVDIGPSLRSGSPGQASRLRPGSARRLGLTRATRTDAEWGLEWKGPGDQLAVNSGKLSDGELAAAHAEGNAGRAEFDGTLQALLAAINGVDQVEVLGRVALALLLRSSTLGRNPHGKGIEIFHVEILQALALSQARNTIVQDNNYAKVTQTCIDLMARNGQAYQKISKLKIVSNVSENERQELIALVQNWTLTVRGPRHAYQTQEYCRAMAVAIDGPFLDHFLCSASDVLDMLEIIRQLLHERVQAHIDGIRSWLLKKSGHAMVEAFVRSLPIDQASRIREATWPLRYDRKVVAAALWNELEEKLGELFNFTIADLTSLATSADMNHLKIVLEMLSLGFGDVTNETLQHLHLSNPVRLKPFVHLDDDSFSCFVPFSIHLNMSEMLEHLCATKPSLKKRLERARAEWLEMKVGALLRQYLPHAVVHSKVTWTDPGSYKGWESDLVVVIVKTVLIFEAQSAKIRALNSLKEALRDLVIDPSEQSLRLKRYIESAPEPFRLTSAEGELAIDPREMRDVIRFNILFDTIGPLSAHWPQMKAAGFLCENVDIAPSISVFELETVFEVLSSELERCHYLSRRGTFERNATYVADELDLLAFYLKTQFNVGNLEFDGPVINLYGLSLDLAVGYTEKRAAGTLNFPIERSSLWKRLLASLQENRPPGWTRFGHRLLCADLQSQRKFERSVKKAWKTMPRASSHFFTTGLTFGSGEHKQTIAFAIGAPDSAEHFSQSLHYASMSAFEQSGSNDLLLIYWFVPATGEPYDFIGVMRRRGV